MDELAYEQGSRAAHRSMLRHCLKELGYEGAKDARWVLEREEALRTLRRICAQYGDNNWNNNLHLSDIIEKHLARHFE